MAGQRIVYAAKVALLAAVYYGAAKFGLTLAFASSSITAIWPPTGIALAALVLGGCRLWPGVALGAFLANSFTGVPLLTVLGITTGNTLEALTGAYLLRRVGRFQPSLERVRDVVALVALAGVVSTAVSATLGVASLLIGDAVSAHELPSAWRTWWLGDMGGDLVVAPALMVAATHWPFRRAPGRLREAAFLSLLVLGVSMIVFSTGSSVVYLVFPPLVWSALRFWQPGAAAASLLVASVAVVATANGHGPFMGGSPDEELVRAQSFVGVAGITALLLAAVITERSRVERALEEIAGTLQESLLPSPLPEIPAIETAVSFRPAGRRQLVGGDFYDVFKGGDGNWAVVVGDVCGKGAAAAAVTGLARYTLRAAAVRESRPSRILAFLNDAIRRQRSPEELCTVAYARIELNGRRRARVTLSSAGHPLPLLLRAGGRVDSLGEPGMVLGALADPELSDSRVDLAPGDAVVLYTDGLTDAYAPARPLPPGELSGVLESCAGMGAAEIAERLERAALEGQEGEPRDDIALLVLRLRELGEARAREVSIRLTSDPRAVSLARSSIRTLEPELGPGLWGDVRLIVSELVTNSVRHARSPEGAQIALRALLWPDRVRVEVSDRGEGFDPSRPGPRPGSASGWGLYLTDRLADRWGVATNGETRVWFEIDR